MTDAPATASGVDRSLEHLGSRLDLIEQRVRAAVGRRRAGEADPDDRFRGLYLSWERASELVERSTHPVVDHDLEAQLGVIERLADDWEATGATLRLRELGRSFGLDELDLEILLIAAAPDLDPRLELLYGYLNDDLTRRRASIQLALELRGLRPTDRDARARFSPGGRLVGGHLVIAEDGDRPFLGRSLRVPDRVTAYLLGDPAPEPAVAAVVHDVPSLAASRLKPLENALLQGISPIYLRQDRGAGASVAAASALGVGTTYVVVDLAALAATPRPAELAADVVREARLARAVLIAASVEAVLERCPEVLPILADPSWPTVIVGDRPWDPAWSRAIPLLLETGPVPREDRDAAWQAALHGRAVADGAGPTEWLRATQSFHLSPLQIARAAHAGTLQAAAHGRPLQPADVQAGARAQNAAGLERLAHRIVPEAGWSALILPVEVEAQLHELAARARQRERVLDDWGIGGRTARGRGISALFAGESGTGKTLAAEVITRELGLDLYVIDLSTVVDKYIGETEKNLDRIFAEADRVNGVLLFDEADALFGKRSEVRDARDRYANVEVAYLLQRMERFDGLAVLTTNLRANLDPAFSRRLDVILDFPMPEEEHRLVLWRMHLPPSLPQAPDLDLAFMARRFRLAGGDIRNICLTAAYLAAEADRPVCMADLIHGTEREYRKLGRLTVESEFGEYIGLIRA
jgi:Winged helix domain, variant/ATPase family associated with various cellular activities (AAA)